MLTIRRAQMEAFGAARLAETEAALQQLLWRHWPAQAAAAGPDGVRRLVATALAAGGARGLDDAGALASYLNVMLALGPEFERDPRFDWARQVLDQTALRPAVRMQRLAALVAARLAAPEGLDR